MSSRESKSGSDGGSEDDNVLDENSIGGFDNDARKSASAISPSLDPLLNDQGDVEIETKSARRRRKAQEKKGLAGGSTMSSSSMAEQQKTIEMLMEMNMKLQSDISEMMGRVDKDKASRRQSIGVLATQNANNVIRSVVAVAESEKMKILTCFSLMSLQRKLNDLHNQGIPASLINYISLNILERILMWLNMGYGQEAGLEANEFESTEDLKRLSDSDLESIMILICRPKEKGQLINLMTEIKVFVSSQTLHRPLYLQMKTTFQAVLSYLHTYERIYKMASGEIGMMVNGVTIGANANLRLEVTSKQQADPKFPETHDNIIKKALVQGDILTLKLFNQLKRPPEQGPAALVMATVSVMQNIHPRRSEMKATATILPKPDEKPTHDIKFTQLCHYQDVKKSEMGKVYLESIRYSLNILLTIYDGIVAPFLAALMNTEHTKNKPTMNVLGHILALEEGSADREAMITSFEESGDRGNHVEYCLHLEEELATARGVAAELEEANRELTAREHTRILNMVQHGTNPVKIPTGYQAQRGHEPDRTILKRTAPGPKKPCFAEARKSNSCTYGDACKYSHDSRDLEILRKDPKAIRSLNVLDEIMEEIPSAYGTAAEAYSQQYQQY